MHLAFLRHVRKIAYLAEHAWYMCLLAHYEYVRCDGRVERFATKQFLLVCVLVQLFRNVAICSHQLEMSRNAESRFRSEREFCERVAAR